MKSLPPSWYTITAFPPSEFGVCTALPLWTATIGVPYGEIMSMPSWVRPPGRGHPNESTNDTGPATGHVEMAPEPDTGNEPPPPPWVGRPICAWACSSWNCWYSSFTVDCRSASRASSAVRWVCSAAAAFACASACSVRRTRSRRSRSDCTATDVATSSSPCAMSCANRSRSAKSENDSEPSSAPIASLPPEM